MQWEKKMNSLALQAYENFAHEESNHLLIKNKTDYEETLAVIEGLMEEVGEDVQNPLNPMISMLASVIEDYENNDPELIAYEESIAAQKDDLAIVRLLIDQHNLTLNDLPEIGSKSMVSRVLSGERELSKKHIAKLSERFNIDPSLFF